MLDSYNAMWRWISLHDFELTSSWLGEEFVRNEAIYVTRINEIENYHSSYELGLLATFSGDMCSRPSPQEAHVVETTMVTDNQVNEPSANNKIQHLIICS